MRNGNAVVFDFDGTLTRRGTYLVRVVNTDTHGKLRRALRAIDGRFRPLAFANAISVPEERQWIERTLRAYARHGLTLADMRRALNDVRLRPGAAELIKELARRGIPQAIVSYGCRPFIDIVLERNGLGETDITVLAADLIFDRSGKVVGHRPETIVVPERKGVFSRVFAGSRGVSEVGLLAVGDSHGDRMLGHLRRHRLGVCEDPELAPALEPYFGEVMVLPDGHFGPAADWLRDRL